MSLETLTLPAALAAGLAGSAHCAAMCGGIATAAGASFRAGAGLPVGPALAFNGARLVGYAAIGALLAGAVGALGSVLPFRELAVVGRIAAVVVMAALALRLLTGRDLLGLDALGAAAWTRLRPAFAHALRLPGPLRHGAMGFLWGWLPCGLVYSVLLVAASTGEPAIAAATMVAFGLGTLPPLLGLTLGAASLGDWLRRPRVRHWAGALVMTCAAWTLAPLAGLPLPGHSAAHATAQDADVRAADHAAEADCHP